jgi:hypothetical protein
LPAVRAVGNPSWVRPCKVVDRKMRLSASVGFRAKGREVPGTSPVPEGSETSARHLITTLNHDLFSPTSTGASRCGCGCDEGLRRSKPAAVLRRRPAGLQGRTPYRFLASSSLSVLSHLPPRLPPPAKPVLANGARPAKGLVEYATRERLRLGLRAEPRGLRGGLTSMPKDFGGRGGGGGGPAIGARASRTIRAIASGPFGAALSGPGPAPVGWLAGERQSRVYPTC